MGARKRYKCPHCKTLAQHTIIQPPTETRILGMLCRLECVKCKTRFNVQLAERER